MTLITCPDCECQFRVTVQSVDPTKKKTPPGSPITPKVLRAVHAFMSELAPGRRETLELYDRFKVSAHSSGVEGLSVNAFSRALVRNGAVRWRDAEKRGVEIPEKLPELPGRVAPTVRERLDSQAYQNALTEHSGGYITGSPVPAVRHPGEEIISPDQVKEKGNDIIARLARERREAREREAAAEVAKFHGGPTDLPPF